MSPTSIFHLIDFGFKSLSRSVRRRRRVVAANWWRYRSEAARTARADSRRSLGLIDGGDGRISKWLAKMIDLETGLSAFNVDQEERRLER
jgi:hypothetical protein